MKNRDSPFVYICSPYSGDVERNTELARRYSRLAVKKGFIPLAAHLLLPQFISEETERELAISLDLKILECCREIWVCGGTISEGMKTEILYARTLGIPERSIKEEEINVRNC